jgi:pimeloyl-ACP methyl ester carboxylesterase
VSCPALVAVGADDRLVPVDAAREVARSLPRAEFQLIRDAGHMVMIEQPAEFDAQLDAFLSVRYPPAVTVLHRQGVRE